MNSDPDRLAFLRAVAGAPNDDTPRLVFADWLDERDGSDADRARAEFIRLSCASKPKARVTKSEREWLAANWQRLLPALVCRLAALGWRPDQLEWTGRRLVLFTFDPTPRGADPVSVSLKAEFWRGFVRRVEYTHGFEEAAASVAADEPLARHETGRRFQPLATGGTGQYRVGVWLRDCFGRAVWDRVAGYTSRVDDPNNPVKRFEQPDSPDAWTTLIRRVHDAIAAAMTARARELAGWPTGLPDLGE
jgi:uncharacterized protein (TIGR02996 family)